MCSSDLESQNAVRRLRSAEAICVPGSGFPKTWKPTCQNPGNLGTGLVWIPRVSYSSSCHHLGREFNDLRRSLLHFIIQVVVIVSYYREDPVYRHPSLVLIDLGHNMHLTVQD